jgi:hypothetical protein
MKRVKKEEVQQEEVQQEEVQQEEVSQVEPVKSKLANIPAKKENVVPVSQPIHDGQVWWKNNGGTFRMGKNRIIKPGEKFLAHPDQISQAFRDVIVPIQRNLEDQVPVKVNIPKYEIQPNEEEGFFDIVNEEGKILNEKPLEETVAKQLLEDLKG